MVLIHKSETGWIPKVGLYIFPILVLLFASLYLADESFYRNVIREDSIAEWSTFGFLIGAGVLSLIIAKGIRKKHQYYHWFFILFCAFNLLAGMEEISWGQRVFGIETTGVFHKYSDQNEINLHNTFQGIFHIKTKHIALLVLLFYGVILPFLTRNRNSQSDHSVLRHLVIPPMFLRGGFALGVILMLDFQTGHEEEIGELFFSICFFIMMLWNLALLKRGYFRPDVYIPSPKRIPSLSE